MAIAKIEKRSSTVWTGPSAMTAGAGAVLAFISLFFLWGAFKSYMVRSNYVEAAFKHDSNRKLEVKSYAEKARSWGSHPESSELLAKALVESNQYDAAEKIYVEAASGDRRAMGLCGQGIVQLRRADAEKDPKKAAEIARKAKDKFNEAKAADSRLVEAQIGAATSDLIAGLKLNDPGKIGAARSDFARILKSLQGSEDLAAGVTREGFIDLYVGLARSNAADEKFSPEALSYAGSARRYLPGSLSLHAMELSLQAQQMVESPPATAEIRAARTFERLKKQKDAIFSSRKTMEEIAGPWFSLTVATSGALSRGGDAAGAKEIESLIQGATGEDALVAEVQEAATKLDAATANPKEVWNRRQSNYQLAYAQFKKVSAMKELDDASRPLLRAAVLNNLAFFEEDYAVLGGGENRYEIAVGLLKKALEAERQAGLPDGSYEVRRNLAVIQKRRDKPDAGDHLLAAQRLAAARPESRIRQDLEDLEKFFRGK